MTVVDARLPEPSAEQIATLDPDVDFDAAYAAGVTFAHRRVHIETFACPRARCRARVGQSCTTPNGWLASNGFHKERVDLAYGRAKSAKPRTHRLSEAQAEAIEIAAHAGAYHAPGQYANFRGDAAARAVGDALVKYGYATVVSEDMYGERRLELTPHGWRTYWHHRLVIRQLPDEQHPNPCHCKTRKQQ